MAPSDALRGCNLRRVTRCGDATCDEMPRQETRHARRRLLSKSLLVDDIHIFFERARRAQPHDPYLEGNTPPPRVLSRFLRCRIKRCSLHNIQLFAIS